MARVLVTGAAGFVGANFVRHMLEKNEDEIFVFLREASDRWRIRDLENRLHIIPLDISEGENVKKAVTSIAPGCVYHFATYGGYPAQQEVPRIFQTNIMGSFYLFEALEHISSLRRLINIGSSSEYGSATPMREDRLIAPNTPYGIAKATQTFLAQHAARERGLPAVTLRFFSVYGPYEKKGRLMCDVMLAFHRGNALALSSPHARRDFVYMDDVMRALTKAATTPRIEGEVFNIGSGTDYSVGDVVRFMEDITKKTVPLRWGAEEKKRIFDTNTRWIADTEKTKRHLGWEPQHPIAEGLEAAYQWYQNHLHLYE